MKERQRLLNYLISKGIIKIEDFYDVTIKVDSIDLQGDNKTKNIAYYARVFRSKAVIDTNFHIVINAVDFRFVFT